MQRNRPGTWCLASLCLSVGLTCMQTAVASDWPMKYRDMEHTGRASFTVPAERLDDTFFNVLAWQTLSPNSPSQGNLSSSSMVFFDGAGPGGADLVVCGYHWPKGVQGMDRHTGQRFWYGNPRGGETIGTSTPAFSLDGSTIYVVNDATGSPEYPLGHPLMAFLAASGPGTYWHNGGDADPNHLSSHSPTIGPDGRIFLHAWVDRAYAGTDMGTFLTETWASATPNSTGHCDPSLYLDGSQLLVITGGRWGQVAAHDGDTGYELWAMPTPTIDATITVDPANGNMYVGAGADDVFIVGLDKYGWPLWGSASQLVYDFIPGDNSPQRAQSAGCLSHDGSTYYFQTNSTEGNGQLYAINTANGTVKWAYPTGSTGWEIISSSPIVTPNGVVVVGNNEGGVYYALQDNGSTATLLDTFAVEDGGTAKSTPTLSDDGLLYLPARLIWTTTNGDGQIPSFDAENIFNAFDLNAGASAILPPPPDQMAVALNSAVALEWQPIIDPTNVFAYYAVYRDTSPFTSVESMTPIGTAPDVNTAVYTDSTAVNGISYYYAVTTVTLTGGEVSMVTSYGPRTPYDETDLQIQCIARTPQYQRYDPAYTYYEVTEPSGFGPYGFTAATGLGSGQTGATQRWPDIGDPVTYTAQVRNRGTNPWAGNLSATWTLDDVVIGTPTQSVSLAHGDVSSFDVVVNWDGELHDLEFVLDIADSRVENNALAISTKSVAFLTYVDVSFIESFREISTPAYPQAATDDMLDWLHRHAARMNEMFAERGCSKRVHYGVLEVLKDYEDDPGMERIKYAIFPFRYYATNFADPRAPGYYHADDDIDYGLCHEMSHQLGLIDIYRMNLAGEQNAVSGLGYSAPAGLMNGVSPFYSEHSAYGMTQWLDTAHGYYGQYMYYMPNEVRLRIFGHDGQPIEGATVSMYQKCERPGLGEVITDQVKAQGTTNALGEFTLPNVPIDPGLVPVTYAGDELLANPFGYVAVVGTNGLLHFKVQHEGFVDYAWLNIAEVNNAYWSGQSDVAIFERQLAIGGDVQLYPPVDMTELNASNWGFWSQDGTITLSDDTATKVVGQASLRCEATGGADNYVRYPYGLLARWDLSDVEGIHFWAYADNPNLGFQNHSPWIRLGNFEDGYFEWRPASDVLNMAIGQWVEFTVPTAGNSMWQRSTVGSPDLAEINYFELHADTWGAGFTLWLDGVGFEPPPLPPLGDMDCDGDVDFDDINPFVLALGGQAAYDAQYPNCRWLNADCDQDGDVDFDDINPFVGLIGG